MKFGINLLLWTDDPTDPALLPLYGRLAAMGYDGVELPIFDGDPERYRVLGTMLDDLGLARTATSALDEHHDPVSPSSAIRSAAKDRLAQVIDCCEAVGATVLGGPLYAAIGRFTGKGPTGEELAHAQAAVAAAADHAARPGITLALEFLNRFETYVLNTAGQTAAFIAATARDNVVIHYDTFHAHIEERDISVAILANARHIGHVHLSENDRGVPGTGQVRWRDTFAALNGIGYDGWLTIESFGQSLPAITAATKIWRPLFDSEEQVAREGLRFVRAMAQDSGL